MAKTNIELATLIMATAKHDAGFGTAEILTAAEAVLAAEDDPVRKVVDRALCDSKDVRIDLLEKEVGNMGVALGYTEGQRDDLIVGLDYAYVALKRCASDFDDADLPGHGRVAKQDVEVVKAVFDKCKSTDTKPPKAPVRAEVAYQTPTTVNLTFNNEDDLRLFVDFYILKNQGG